MAIKAVGNKYAPAARIWRQAAVAAVPEPMSSGDTCGFTRRALTLSRSSRCDKYTVGRSLYASLLLDGHAAWNFEFDVILTDLIFLQGQQRERQKQSMGVADRAMYKFGQLVFGSQSVRLFTFVYLLVLHLLVFGSLVRMTHHSSNQLYEHQQSVLDSRHDATGVLHHELTAVAPRLP